MRIVDFSSLVPYQEFPLPPDAREQCLSPLRERAESASGFPVTPEQEARWVNRSAIWDAEFHWLVANLPVGSVFSYIGVSVMVVSGPHHFVPAGKGPDFRGPQHFAVTCQCAADNGGLKTMALTVPELRAAMEQGFVMPRRDPFFYGPEGA